MLGFFSLPAKLSRQKQAGILGRVKAHLNKDLNLACQVLPGTMAVMLHSSAVNLQDPRPISSHNHQCIAGAAAGIEAGTPKRGLESVRKLKGALGVSLWVLGYSCVPA